MPQPQEDQIFHTYGQDGLEVKIQIFKRRFTVGKKIPDQQYQVGMAYLLVRSLKLGNYHGKVHKRILTVVAIKKLECGFLRKEQA